MFDRDREWSALVGFARSGQNGPTLGIVSGRRRQGKTFLLEALCRESGGYYFSAEDAAQAESLRYLGITLGRFHGSPGPIHLPDWRAAVDALLHLGRDREIPVVLDEFPYLVKASPSLPSVIQGALTPLREERQESRMRLLLCGSAMSFMGTLLAGNTPLRGRAWLEMVVPTLGYRLAAEFWGIADPLLGHQGQLHRGGNSRLPP